MFPANIYAFFLVFDVYYWYKLSSNTHKICFIHDIKASHQFGRLGVEWGVGLGTFQENKREKRFTTYTKPIVYRMRVALYVSISHRQWLPQCPFGKSKMPVLHCKNGLFTPLNMYSQKKYRKSYPTHSTHLVWCYKSDRYAAACVQKHLTHIPPIFHPQLTMAKKVAPSMEYLLA